jgi:hypothetical protein
VDVGFARTAVNAMLADIRATSRGFKGIPDEIAKKSPQQPGL